MHFERPHLVLEHSYRGLVREFVDAGEPLVPFSLAMPNEHFGAFLDALARYASGQGIPDGFVPHSTFWVVHEGEVAGVSNLRHRLTDALREEGGHIGYGVRPSARRKGVASALLVGTLAEARMLGISRVLLTCAKSNVGSVATIVRHGGKLESEGFVPRRGVIVQRYWIEVG